MDSRLEGQYFSFVLYVKKGEPSSVFSGRVILSDNRPVRLRTGSYTVRVRAEPESERVRGTIRHEETGRAIHFQSSGRVAEFIQECLAGKPEPVGGVPDPPSSLGGQPPLGTHAVSATITVSNEQEITLHRTLMVEVYEKIDFTVPSGATDMAVELLPREAGPVRFLLMTSDHYGDHLSYKVDPQADEQVLDGPHFLMSAGVVSLLNLAPDLLLFSNTLAEDARIEISIGRDTAP